MAKNLTKENFWNELQEKCPAQMKVFCDWIDKYKLANEWAQLFNYGSPHYAKMGWHTPKFHDLPFAMQVGIFLQFVSENPKDHGFEIGMISKFEDFISIPTLIQKWFFTPPVKKENNDQ